MKLQEMLQEQKEALDVAEGVMATAERANRGFTAAEQETYTNSMNRYQELGRAAAAKKELNTIRLAFPNGMPGIGTPSGVFNAPANAADFSPLRAATARNPEYAKALQAYLCTGGKQHAEELTTGADGVGGYIIPGSEAYTRQRLANGKMNAATYEGSQGSSDAAGGYAISVPTEQLIVPLALPDLGIFDASMVIPTATDVKIPVATAFGTSTIKAESTGTLATFGGTDPTLGQFTLTAFMAGALRWVSWELLQDVQTFQQFVVDDLIKGQRILEGSLLASGNGTTQPLGVFSNTGTGTGSAYNFAGTAADSTTLLNSLFDVTSTLKGAYQSNASWVMSRATALTIRRAQMQSNLFVPVATLDADGTERILGRPVYFDVDSPALPTATTAGVVPILFGDFKQGYIVGVRGGSGINVKILDQPMAAQGQLGILAYRRLDGRVRRSEAIQAITVSHT
ncbi:MAG: phage major capsid protein [Terracidiphilus sp.]